MTWTCLILALAAGLATALPKPQVGIAGPGIAFISAAAAGSAARAGVGVPPVVIAPPSFPALGQSSLTRSNVVNTSPSATAATISIARLASILSPIMTSAVLSQTNIGGTSLPASLLATSQILPQPSTVPQVALPIDLSSLVSVLPPLPTTTEVSTHALNISTIVSSAIPSTLLSLLTTSPQLTNILTSPQAFLSVPSAPPIEAMSLARASGSLVAPPLSTEQGAILPPRPSTSGPPQQLPLQPSTLSSVALPGTELTLQASSVPLYTSAVPLISSLAPLSNTASLPPAKIAFSSVILPQVSSLSPSGASFDRLTSTLKPSTAAQSLIPTLDVSAPPAVSTSLPSAILPTSETEVVPTTNLPGQATSAGGLPTTLSAKILTSSSVDADVPQVQLAAPTTAISPTVSVDTGLVITPVVTIEPSSIGSLLSLPGSGLESQLAVPTATGLADADSIANVASTTAPQVGNLNIASLTSESYPSVPIVSPPPAIDTSLVPGLTADGVLSDATAVLTIPAVSTIAVENPESLDMPFTTVNELQVTSVQPVSISLRTVSTARLDIGPISSVDVDTNLAPPMGVPELSTAPALTNDLHINFTALSQLDSTTAVVAMAPGLTLPAPQPSVSTQQSPDNVYADATQATLSQSPEVGTNAVTALAPIEIISSPTADPDLELSSVQLSSGEFAVPTTEVETALPTAPDTGLEIVVPSTAVVPPLQSPAVASVSDLEVLSTALDLVVTPSAALEITSVQAPIATHDTSLPAWLSSSDAISALQDPSLSGFVDQPSTPRSLLSPSSPQLPDGTNLSLVASTIGTDLASDGTQLPQPEEALPSLDFQQDTASATQSGADASASALNLAKPSVGFDGFRQPTISVVSLNDGLSAPNTLGAVSQAPSVSAAQPATAPSLDSITSSVPIAVNTDVVASALDEVGVELVQNLANALVQVMSLLAAARASDPVPTRESKLPTNTPAAFVPPAIPQLTTSLSSPQATSGVAVTSQISNSDAALTPSATPDAESFSASERSSTSSDPNWNKLRRGLLPTAPALNLPPSLPNLGVLPVVTQIQSPDTTTKVTSTIVSIPLLPTASVERPSISTAPILAVSSVGEVSSIPSPTLSASPAVLLSVPPHGAGVSTPLPSVPVSGESHLSTASVLPPVSIPSIGGGAPVIGTAALPIAAGSTVLDTVNSAPIPSELPQLLQGVKNAAVANITEAVTNVPLIGQAEQVLAILQLLAIMTVGQFGSLATLTNLPAVQSAVTVINQPDLTTVVKALEGKSIVQSTAADGLLSNVIGFVRMVEKLLPLVTNIKAVVSYIILQQLGLTALTDVVDGSLVSSLPGGS